MEIHHWRLFWSFKGRRCGCGDAAVLDGSSLGANAAQDPSTVTLARESLFVIDHQSPKHYISTSSSRDTWVDHKCLVCWQSVEFRVPPAQVIERIIVFIGARYKHVTIHEENGCTNMPFSARISADTLQGPKHRERETETPRRAARGSNPWHPRPRTPPSRAPNTTGKVISHLKPRLK
jgi:hypothetical protein